MHAPEDPRTPGPEGRPPAPRPGELPRLYAVLDVPTLLRLGLASDTTLPADAARAVQALVDGGVRLIQLRIGEARLEPLVAQRLAARVIEAARASSRGTLVLVNDDLELARRSGADGVHLGAGDPPPDDARALLGEAALIGATVRHPDDLRRADRPLTTVDYLGAGPVRATSTKPGLPAPIGFAGLAAVARAATVPVFAIGGLRLDDVGRVHESGAHGVAMVRGLLDELVPVGGAR